jgi:hypothetical protein
VPTYPNGAKDSNNPHNGPDDRGDGSTAENEVSPARGTPEMVDAGTVSGER